MDYDFKPSNSSRVYGWVSQVNTEEQGDKKTGYGFRALVTNRFSDKLFALNISYAEYSLWISKYTLFAS